MLCNAERRKPNPGKLEQAFLDELEAHDIPVGPYNLPDWDLSPAGFRHCLDSLFTITPPTALIIDHVPRFHAAEIHLARRGILCPEHVSLVSTNSSVTFGWGEFPAAHIHWDENSMTRRVERWADNVARGKDDRRKTFTKAEFVEGGSIRPAPGVS
jgi:DNA-binding LacI/PurR family transcriptional regulator